jgi:pimeloyl-ACP methyl ester carboxylesterase
MYRAMRNLMVGRPDLTERFRSLRVPILLLAGSDDPLWTPSNASAAARSSVARLATPPKSVRRARVCPAVLMCYFDP